MNKLRIDYRPNEIFQPEYFNKANAQINQNTDDVAILKNVTDSLKEDSDTIKESAKVASQSAEDASKFVKNVLVAMEELPDGTAVTAKVAVAEALLGRTAYIVEGSKTFKDF